MQVASVCVAGMRPIKNALQLQFPEWPAILYFIPLQLSAERVAMCEFQEAKYHIVNAIGMDKWKLKSKTDLHFRALSRLIKVSLSPR